MAPGIPDLTASARAWLNELLGLGESNKTLKYQEIVWSALRNQRWLSSVRIIGPSTKRGSRHIIGLVIGTYDGDVRE